MKYKKSASKILRILHIMKPSPRQMLCGESGNISAKTSSKRRSNNMLVVTNSRNEEMKAIVKKISTSS
jgi:hypothetical protein